MTFTEVKTVGSEELLAGQMEGVVTMNGNHYVGLVETNDESPYGVDLLRKYHSTPYKDKEQAVKAAKDLSYAYRG